MLQRRRLVVLFGGQSAEHDVSCISARHVIAAVDAERHHVEPVLIGRDGRWRHPDGAELNPFELLGRDGEDTVVFPVLHGPNGEDGTIQGLLEICDVAYVGSGVLASAVAMDKIKSKELFDAHGIAQARWRGLHVRERSPALESELIERLGLPMFVKPANMGSSVGVSRVGRASELRDALDHAGSYDEWIVVEENIVGREIEVAVIGNLEPRASEPGEIKPGAAFYDYDDKYADGADLVVPAPLSDQEAAALRSVALDAYRALRCEGLARVDFFFEEGGRGWLVNEINTMPGFTPISMYPKMWQASGLDYSDLINELTDLAVERHQRRRHHRRMDR